MKERLRAGQVGALLVAFSGVVYLTLYYGQFPWIALCLACSFAVYGLLHKKTSMPALEGLCLETMVLFLPAAAFLIQREVAGTGSFGHGGITQTVLLFGTGLITSLPLLLFGYAAQKISLTHLGLLQYIAPSINLLLGIYLYHEPFPVTRVVGFVLIWSALLLYIAEGLLLKNRQRRLLRASV
jgi:chloramphenicol-sensitive protein RarD